LTRFLLTLMLGAFIAGPAWAQQSDEQDTDLAADEATDEADIGGDADADAESESEAEAEVEEEEEPEEFDEAGLDEQGFSNEDDDFRPSEVIPTDQSIEFPTDI